jgi:hypothetical protein
MPKFKLIKQLEKNLKLVEEETPTNFITKWFKKFRMNEIKKRICNLRDSMKKK